MAGLFLYNQLLRGYHSCEPFLTLFIIEGRFFSDFFRIFNGFIFGRYMCKLVNFTKLTRILFQ